MKVIMIISDTFRRDHVGAYGNPWIHTTHLDALARCSGVFENAFVGSFPTGPNRRDTLLGHSDRKQIFNAWRFIENNEITLPEILGDKKIVSQLITDVANCVSRGRNYYKGFTSWAFNRGQEGDPCWLNDDVPLVFTCDPSMVRYPDERWHQVLMNRAHRMVETDWFAPGTFNMAIDWLTQNHRRKDFLLWIDTFDPHEPWDPPQHYIDLYDPDFKGTLYEAPTYGLRRKMGITDRELKQIRARYAGEVSMVDNWVGQLVASLHRLSIHEETAIIFTSDHGAYFDYPGDSGLLCKPVRTAKSGHWVHGAKAPKDLLYFPMRLALSNIPLIIHLPGQTKGRRVKAITQPWDLMPTMLQLFGIKPPKTCIGRSLVPLVTGKKKTNRAHAVYGLGSSQAHVANGRWLYAAWRDAAVPPMLFDRKSDLHLQKNVAGKHVDVVRKLHKELIAFARSADALEDTIEGWNTL